MLPGPGCGFRDEHDFVAAKLDREIVALDAFRAVRQHVAVHIDIFAPMHHAHLYKKKPIERRNGSRPSEITRMTPDQIIGCFVNRLRARVIEARG